MAREFAPRIHFAHLRNVTLEPDGSFPEADLNGGVDMVSLVEVLLREERTALAEGRRSDIPMRPDHGHLPADDIAKRTNPGYSYIGRLSAAKQPRGHITRPLGCFASLLAITIQTDRMLRQSRCGAHYVSTSPPKSPEEAPASPPCGAAR